MAKDFDVIVEEASKIEQLTQKGRLKEAYAVWTNREYIQNTILLSKKGFKELATCTGSLFFYKNFTTIEKAYYSVRGTDFAVHDVIGNLILNLSNLKDKHQFVWQGLSNYDTDNIEGYLYRVIRNRTLKMKSPKSTAPPDDLNTPNRENNILIDISKKDILNILGDNTFIVLFNNLDISILENRPESVLRFYSYVIKYQDDFYIPSNSLSSEVPHWFITLSWLELKIVEQQRYTTEKNEKKLATFYYDEFETIFPGLNKNSLRAQKKRRLNELGEIMNHLNQTKPDWWEDICTNYPTYYKVFALETGI
ncbi:hypothetical protein [Rhodohalobacter mucosus]|uniref:Uncharacterized protein n=1 Tax=Rhodohalobacter mucosus TaxID=2079485 RepID=A0A316TVB2_9BACT|nr:hypothetical protein [Rhodohalobacter mucosus]PWN06364.1 hypothetical protein DDZ15_11120 [Rhodohalobacter mucosus]